MGQPEHDEIRAIVLDRLRDGAPVARGALLHEVARRHGIEPRQRRLRAQVAHVLRELEAEGRLVDGGPEVWLDPRCPSDL